ncbi:MAG: hypothetical protein QXS68_06545 [Candidatus Methanomethylicaceae archaeon]
MKRLDDLNRREFVKILGAGAGAVVLGGLMSGCTSILGSSQNAAQNGGSIIKPSNIGALEIPETVEALKTSIKNINAFRQCEKTGTCSVNLTKKDLKNTLNQSFAVVTTMKVDGTLAQADAGLRKPKIKKKIIDIAFADDEFELSLFELGLTQVDIEDIKGDIKERLSQIKKTLKKVGLERIITEPIQGLINKIDLQPTTELWFSSGGVNCAFGVLESGLGTLGVYAGRTAMAKAAVGGLAAIGIGGISVATVGWALLGIGAAVSAYNIWKQCK